MNTRRRDSLKGDEKLEKIGDERPVRPKHEREPEAWQTLDSVVQQRQCSGIQADSRYSSFAFQVAITAHGFGRHITFIWFLIALPAFSGHQDRSKRRLIQPGDEPASGIRASHQNLYFKVRNHATVVASITTKFNVCSNDTQDKLFARDR